MPPAARNSERRVRDIGKEELEIKRGMVILVYL
jgi:hypothetical protein